MAIMSPGLFPSDQSAGYYPPAPSKAMFPVFSTDPNSKITPQLLLALGSGLLSGNTWNEQIANAGLGANQAVTAQVAKQKADAEKNLTVAALQPYPDLANAVSIGAMTPALAYGEMLKRKQAEAEAAKPKYMVVDGRIVQTNSPDGIKVAADFSQPKKPDYKSVGGLLFNPDTQEWIKPPADMATDHNMTNDQKDLIAAGLKPGTPEFQQALLNLHKLGAKPGQASPKLTEDQSKNVGFLIRAKNAEKILSDPAVLDDPKYAADPSAIPPTNETQGLSRWNQFAGALPLGVGNSIISNDAQSYNQAKLNFITAALRKESGAAISQSEYDNAEKTYFPQPGDSRQQIEQKRQAREDVIKGFEISAGPGAEIASENNSNVMTNPNVTNPANMQQNTGVTKSGVKFTVSP